MQNQTEGIYYVELSTDKEDVVKNKNPFSLADIKNTLSNEFLFNRIILMFGFNPNSNKIKSIRDKFSLFGKIAA